MTMRALTLLAMTVVFVPSARTLAAEKVPANEIVNFSRQVRPILSDNCFKCHGPDKKARKGDLRLDRRNDAKDVLKLDAKKSSELIAKITTDDPEEHMPPAKSNRSLTPQQIETLTRWVRQGAPYEQHWSFQPIKKPALPKVKRADWPRGEVDRFVLARLEKEGLNPAAEAARERLIRRVSFDLTGLPPTPKEIDAFLADKSKDAYEKLVDRLLAKSAYGERMASDWLDVARYSDSYGYQVDRDRYVWPWRDWVIKALNANMPYDQFVTEQLAGDLLPGATDQQILATTFNRLHPQKVEGGSTEEEFRVEYVADRNHTFGTAFLGLALECARCHDHKFDPIQQAEYYKLFAYFNTIDESGLYSYFTGAIPTPTLLMTDAATKASIASVEKQITQAEAKLKKVASDRKSAFQTWLSSRPQKAEIPGRVARQDFEKFKGGANKSVAGHVGKAVKLSGDDAFGIEAGNFRRFDPFSVALWMNTPDEKKRAVVFHHSKAWTDSGSRGYQLLIEEGRLSMSLIHFWPGNAIRVRTKEKIPSAKWLHVTVTYDGSSRADGLRIFVDGKPAETEVVRDNLYKFINGSGKNIAIGQRFRDRGFTNGLVDEFQVFNRQLAPIEVEQVHDGKTLAVALAAPAGKLTASQRESLLAFYLTNFDTEYKTQLAAVRKARVQRSSKVDRIQEIMVMREMAQPRQTHLLTRGAYNKPAQRVTAGTPAVLPPFPAGAPNNRLGLARWLTSDDHPLTARVTVNRLWQLCFGAGLVRTPEDFGSQGQPPTHPQLLDWLARDFIKHDWDVKRLLKLMVTSATYRQSSSAPANLLARDPENRLLARASRYRLSAEMLRDNVLAVSGLLVNKVGGASVRPYEVEASFKPVGRTRGEGLYRRSVYTYWKRTAPAPAMMALDASKREVCRVRRERTTSPLQAFVLLNGPQYVEAARMLAEREIKLHGDNTDAILAGMFRELTSRKPRAAETKLLVKLYLEQLADFEKNPKRAEAFLKTGDRPRDKKLPAARTAALGVVASMLMNFDQSVMKR
jgi:hypothetical protein